MAAAPAVSAAAQVNAKCCNTTAAKTPGRLEVPNFPLVRLPATVFSLENHLPVGEMLHDSDPTVALQATAAAVVALNHLVQTELTGVKEKLAALHAEIMEGINDESYSDDEAAAGPARKKTKMMEMDSDTEDE